MRACARSKSYACVTNYYSIINHNACRHSRLALMWYLTIDWRGRLRVSSSRMSVDVKHRCQSSTLLQLQICMCLSECMVAYANGTDYWQAGISHPSPPTMTFYYCSMLKWIICCMLIKFCDNAHWTVWNLLPHSRSEQMNRFSIHTAMFIITTHWINGCYFWMWFSRANNQL